MHHVTSRQNPVVSRYRAIVRGPDRSQLLIDGPHLLTDALDAHMTVTDAVVRLDALEDPEIRTLVTRLVAENADVRSASPRVMETLSPVRSASPIVAVAQRPSTAVDVYTPSPALVVCAVDVQDPGNVGAIVRVAEAGGATGVVVTGQSADPFGWKALRGAMGSTFRLPIQHSAEPRLVIEDAQRRGCRVWVTSPRGGRPFDEADLSGPALVLVGGEGPGLPPTLLEAADARLSIPMKPAVESLNTAVCAALLVYEARRQRGSRQAGRRVSG
jgi:TrmH family RNA methyltransferase